MKVDIVGEVEVNDAVGGRQFNFGDIFFTFQIDDLQLLRVL